MKAMAYLRLMRFDVALIAVFSYLLGVEMSGTLGLRDVWISLLVCFISTNFVYALNAWSDAEIDRINKPRRPIPAGRITRREALRYALALLALACVFPFFVTPSWQMRMLFLMIPLIGILYSLPVFGVRRHSGLAVFLTSLGLLIPAQLGYLMGGGGLGQQSFFLALFMLVVSIVALKDIEDVEGDVRFGADNLFVRFGGRLLWFCRLGLAITFLLAIALPIRPALKAFLYISVAAAVSLTIFARPVEIIYRSIIRASIISGFCLFLFLLCCGP